MFENLTERLSGTFRKLTGKATLTESNIQEALREVRRALLEADVALPVVKDFIDRVSARAVGQEVSKSLTPGQAFIKLVQAEMQTIMGSANAELNLKSVPPAVVLPPRALEYLGAHGADALDDVPQLGQKRAQRYGAVLRELCDASS